jgi:carbonic anhydrase
LPDDRSELERVLDANRAFEAAFVRDGLAGLSARPARRLAVVACMDARIDVHAILGLAPGDAHVIRNAGGRATDDAISSLAISRHLLGTDTALIVEHTQCGLLGLDDDETRRDLAARTGSEVELPIGGFPDLDENLRAQVTRVSTHPWTAGMTVQGLVYDVATGRLRAVS